MISQSTPIDSLYKFIAIFGLVIMIASATFKFFAITDIQRSVAELKINQAKVLVYIEAKDIGKNELTRLRLEFAEAKARTISAGEKVKMFTIFDFRATIFLCIGIMLSIAGFSLWYKKLQKYHDIQIKNQSELKSV